MERNAEELERKQNRIRVADQYYEKNIALAYEHKNGADKICKYLDLPMLSILHHQQAMEIAMKAYHVKMVGNSGPDSNTHCLVTVSESLLKSAKDKVALPQSQLAKFHEINELCRELESLARDLGDDREACIRSRYCDRGRPHSLPPHELFFRQHAERAMELCDAMFRLL